MTALARMDRQTLRQTFLAFALLIVAACHDAPTAPALRLVAKCIELAQDSTGAAAERRCSPLKRAP